MLAMLRFAWGTQAQVVDPDGPGTPPAAAPAWRAGRRHSAYWPQHELDSFILQMAGHGHCVHSAMMLGDFDYAREQLALAVATGCPKLRALGERLSAYFDQAPCACSIETH